ncbi:MAG: phosphoribosylanthranilate isomerase [Candidatus Sulfobium sp.]|jgi:phosphoribosylanthranilate isomerase
MVKVKICGITNLEDAGAAVGYGADALGFVFYRNSPRFISPEKASSIIRSLPSFVVSVGVFVNETPENIQSILSSTGLDVIQLHGEETPDMCAFSRRVVKAIRVKSLESLSPLEGFRNLVSAFLLDTYTPDSLGGTGRIFNWDIAVEAKQFGRVILAGGLTPENVAAAVGRVRPYAVDVSSGIEHRKGKKDHEKMKRFIENAKTAL